MKKAFIVSSLLGLTLSSSVFAEDVAIQPISATVAVPTLYAVPVTTSAPLVAATPVSLSSDVVLPSVPEITSVAVVTEKAEVFNKNTSVSKMKARGVKMIEERINALNSNAKAIANAKLLTADQKTAFATFFSGKVTELTVLKTNLTNSADATTTKTLVSSITNDFRIYAIVIPQSRLQKRLYELQNHTTKVTDSFVKIQARIDEAKAKGKDVTVWQKNLDTTKTLVASTTVTIPTLLAQVNALKPTDYGTTSKMLIESVNKSVKQIAKDLQSVGKNVKRPELKALRNTASSTKGMR